MDHNIRKNQIYNIDCIKFMQNNDFYCDHIITDIPYDVVSRETGGIRVFDKKDADILTFDLDMFCSLIKERCKKNILIFCSSEQVSKLTKNLENDYFVKLGVWEKTNPSPVNGQHFWLSGIECCVVASKEEISDEDLIWTTPAGRSKNHPTEKPQKLIDIIVNKFTSPKDVVYDPCAGSGSHLLSIMNNGRFFIGNEISDAYFNLIKGRLGCE